MIMEKKSNTYKIASEIEWEQAGVLIDTFTPMREDFLKQV